MAPTPTPTPTPAPTAHIPEYMRPESPHYNPGYSPTPYQTPTAQPAPTPEARERVVKALSKISKGAAKKGVKKLLAGSADSTLGTSAVDGIGAGGILEAGLPSFGLNAAGEIAATQAASSIGANALASGAVPQFSFGMAPATYSLGTEGAIQGLGTVGAEKAGEVAATVAAEKVGEGAATSAAGSSIGMYAAPVAMALMAIQAYNNKNRTQRRVKDWSRLDKEGYKGAPANRYEKPVLSTEDVSKMTDADLAQFPDVAMLFGNAWNTKLSDAQRKEFLDKLRGSGARYHHGRIDIDSKALAKSADEALLSAGQDPFLSARLKERQRINDALYANSYAGGLVNEESPNAGGGFSRIRMNKAKLHDQVAKFADWMPETSGATKKLAEDLKKSAGEKRKAPRGSDQ